MALSCRICGSVSAWDSWRVAAEGEHCGGDEGLWAVESERDSREQADLGVRGFDQSSGDTVFEVVVDGLTVSGDLVSKFDKRCGL